MDRVVPLEALVEIVGSGEHGDVLEVEIRPIEAWLPRLSFARRQRANSGPVDWDGHAPSGDDEQAV